MSDLEDKVLNEIGKIIDLETGLALRNEDDSLS